MDPNRLKTLILVATVGLAGALAGRVSVSEGDLDNLTDQDFVMVYKGNTLAVHAVDLRQPTTDGGVAVKAYGTVQTLDASVVDLGEVNCEPSNQEQGRLVDLLAMNFVKNCAQGDSGIPLAQLFVHAADLRRRVLQSFPDGGATLSNTLTAYATRLTDGGLPPVQTCNLPDAGQAIFDRIGLACVRRGKGLGQ